MVDRREIITICRQIGNMMDAGVDILRITQVLRAQTDNARLLRIFDEFDHDLRMGASIAEAMTRASDVFSPFMITLVRQAEQRGDLETISKHVAAAFLKIAEFLQQDEDTHAAEAESHAPTVIAAPFDISALAETPESWPLTIRAIENLTDRLQMIALRALTLTAGLLLSMAAVWWSMEMGFIEKRWLNVTLCSVSALFIAGAGVWVRRRIEKERLQAQRCSFCNHEESEEFPLRPVPGFAGAAICPRCAALLAQRHAEVAAGAEATAYPTEPSSSSGPPTATPASTTVVKVARPAATPAAPLKATVSTGSSVPASTPATPAAPSHPARTKRTLSGGADEATYE